MIFEEGSLNLPGLEASDVYLVLKKPQTPLIRGLPTDGIGLVGTAAKGPLNTPVLLGTIQALTRSFGLINTTQYDLVTEAIGAFKQGAQKIYAVRVADGTQTSGTATIQDSAAATLITLTAKSTGSWSSGVKVELGVGSNNVATPAIGTVTIGGTWANGNTATYTFNSTVVQHTVVGADTTTNIANELAKKINANTTVNKLVRATVNGAVITVTAINPGTVANSLTTTATQVSGSGTVTVSGSTLGGGTGTAGVGVATYKAIISSETDDQEIFDNISGTLAGVGAGTVALNLTNAINNGISGFRLPSKIVSAALGGGAASIQIQTSTMSAGVDGRTVNAANLTGVDGVTGRTGMYALRETGISQFGLSGLTDTATWPEQLTFAKSENLFVPLVVASGTSSQAAVGLKNSQSLDDWHFSLVKDYLYLNDTINGVIRLVSPLGATLGRIATLSPERSPGNKPIEGYLGTERTGYLSGTAILGKGAEYSRSEIGLLETAGVLFMTKPSVGGNYLSLRHGQNGSSDPRINGINYSKLTPFLARSIKNAMGWAVHEVHTPELRRKVKSAISEFLSTLADPGPGLDPMIGDANGGPAYSVTINNENNPPSQVALGFLNVYVQIKYLSIVRFFIISIEAGQSVTVNVQNSPLIQAQSIPGQLS